MRLEKSQNRLKNDQFHVRTTEMPAATSRDGIKGRKNDEYFSSLLGRLEEARSAYYTAMQSADQRPWAFRRWCETHIVPSISRDEALACTAGLVNEYPEEAEALFMRAWVLRNTGDATAGGVAEKFFAVVDTKDVRQRQMAEQLTGLMGKH